MGFMRQDKAQHEKWDRTGGLRIEVEGSGMKRVLFQEFFLLLFLACSIRVFEKYLGANRRFQSMVEE